MDDHKTAQRGADPKLALELSEAIARQPWTELRLQALTSGLRNLFACGLWGVFNVAGDRPTLDIYLAKRFPAEMMEGIMATAISTYNALEEATLALESPLVTTHEEDTAPGPIGSGRAQIQLPLIAGGRTTGLVFLYSDHLDSYAPEDVQLFSLLVNQIAVTLESVRLLQEMLEQVTGVSDVGRFKEALGLEFRRSRRYGHKLSLALVDVDGLKDTNDRYGHPAGDELLREVASMIRTRLRSTDVVSRCGGDEFGIILTDTGEDGAHAMAENLVSMVAMHPIYNGDIRLKTTVSVGIAGLQGNPTLGPQELVARADAALQAAKRAGGNTVRRFAPLAMSSTTAVTALRRAWQQGSDWQE